MTIRMIWAEAQDGVIGSKGQIPWKVPGEQKIFRDHTIGSTVVMGRTTWDSLLPRFRPLQGRRNVVLTRKAGWSAEGVEAFASIEDLLQVHDDFWVMGGAVVYAEFLPRASRIVRTRIDLAVEGDAFAPRLGPEWQLAAGADRYESDTGVTYTVEELTSGRA